MKLIPLPAFTDNYIWMLHDGHQATVVDPGDAHPVLDALQHLHVQLEAILVTRHHPDHTGRVATGAIQTVQGFDASASDGVSIFATLRRSKNEFQ